MPDVAEIAGRLSEAQRRLILNHPFWAASTYGTIKACRTRGLLDGPTLTPLGLAVRAYLENSREQ